MEEEQKKKNSKSKKSSEIQKKITKKNINEIDSEVLLEQILSKKKNKETKPKNNTIKKEGLEKKSSANNSVKKKKTINNNIRHETSSKEISNDELFDKIKAKKNKKKSKSNVKSKETSIVIDNKIDVNKQVDKIVEKKENLEIVNLNQEIEDVVDSDSSKIIDNDDTTIITRELNFDADKFDIKNEDLLKELKDAIQEFDSLDSDQIKLDKEKFLEEENNLFESSKFIVKGKRSEKYKDLELIYGNKKILFKKRYLVILVVLLIIIFFCSLFFTFGLKDNKSILEVPKDIVKNEEDIKSILYQNCLNRNIIDNEKTDEILFAEDELKKYLKDNYNVSVLYEDLSLGYRFSYNTDEVYYAASTIKLLGALYIYNEASKGNIDLDDTMTYTSKFKWGASAEVGKLDYGTKISLRNLVKYSVTVSDNSAHQMLVSYIGRKNLKDYGKSLGAKYTLSGSDNFGNINVEDAIIYVKELNNFINNNGELGKELKSYFVSALQNDLAISDFNIEAAHKYGQYKNYYHDIGIVYDENPYVVAILTTEGAKNYEEKIKDINKRIYSLHKLYRTNKENICKTEVYGK